ncbi:SDR family NAD(P)-dependent oxidoreductase [Synoicihabitans lomoniglobus]|uniref:SDR family oxidoreductase n=1 Tax=Synoicihabitans lomoniglobus TaxID=2909285 RepID=A0AAF0I3R2_9BACT|nr:SDR family oxidoreductase [Opitutaceae bacterium LMO-M01]WED66075.1 SDR family oxidoreductase [Opitutaceae bacterium LMO-M01]
MNTNVKTTGRLPDQVILVTGSTTGIGEAMVRRFAREGATVVVHGTREDAARQLVTEIEAEGGNGSWITAPLTAPEAPAKIMAHVIERWGRLDALVNNAAITARSSIETTDPEAFDRFIGINLKAPFFLIQAALPHFRSRGGGRVLNIGSINSYCGERNMLPYSISKGGLVTLTRSLADSLGVEGVRVNLLNVGWTLTPNEYQVKLKDGLSEGWPDRLPRSLAPGGRLFRPDEVAMAALYFLAEESALVNGAVLDLEQFPLIGRNPVKESEDDS